MCKAHVYKQCQMKTPKFSPVPVYILHTYKTVDFVLATETSTITTFNCTITYSHVSYNYAIQLTIPLQSYPDLTCLNLHSFILTLLGSVTATISTNGKC